MNLRLVAEKLAQLTTRQIAIHWGETLGFYYVCEHPKSGGTWLAKMVGDYLQLPFPQHSVLPLGFRCIVKNHLRYDRRLRRVFYLYRDGRDVLVSLYYDRVRTARHAGRPGSDYVGRTYERLLGKNYDPNDIVRHLPRFIEYEFDNPGRGTPLNWRDHIDDWYAPGERNGIVYLSYEGLLNDCSATLGGALCRITGEEVDAWQLSTTIEKMSMVRQTGRSPGEDDIKQHIRKGVAGDWTNYFSRETAELFDDLAGDTLVRLGYEEDRGWVDRYEYPTP
ncbi:MAG: sulfotransferase domain-containing protein [Acidobacteriota bacterium]|jgi:hypothetical protein